MLNIPGLEACDPWGEEDVWDPCLEACARLAGTIALVGVLSLFEDDEVDPGLRSVAWAGIAAAELLDVKLRSDNGSFILLAKLVRDVLQQRVRAVPMERANARIPEPTNR